MHTTKTLFRTVAIASAIFWISVCLGGESDRKGLEAPSLILKMCQSSQLETSLSGMMLSVDLLERAEIIEYISRLPDDSDKKWTNAVKRYSLARLTLDNQDALRFIRSIPEDEAELQKMIEFESKLFRHPPSKILVFLVELAETGRGDSQIQDIAREKVKKVHSVADGWVADFLSESRYEWID